MPTCRLLFCWMMRAGVAAAQTTSWDGTASGKAKDRPAVAERLAKQAVKHLEGAFQSGFFGIPAYKDLIHKDSDLAALRSRDDFKDFVKRRRL